LLACVTPEAGAVTADSEIGVSVCGGNVPPSQITITQPLSDSVVNQSVTTFRGTIARASQVEITIDGQYNTTVAIGANDSTFQVDVTIPKGTHTIEMQANAICGGQDSSDSVVVTYQPIEEPTNGDTTPTTIGGDPVSDSQDLTGQAISDNDIVRQIEQLPVVGAAVSVVSDFAVAIGLTGTIASSSSAPVAGVARVGVTVAALTTVVMASSIAPVAAQALPGVSEMFNVTSHRSMLYLGWAIRGAGVLAMALVYFL